MMAISLEFGAQENSYTCSESGREPVTCAVGDVDRVDALDLYAVFADDAAPGRHGVECAGAAGGVLDEEERDGLAVGRPGGLGDLARDVGELLDLA